MTYKVFFRVEGERTYKYEGLHGEVQYGGYKR